MAEAKGEFPDVIEGHRGPKGGCMFMEPGWPGHVFETYAKVTPYELATLRRLRAGELVAVEAAQAAGLAAGTHVVVPVDVLLAVLDEAAADSIYASCKCLSPDEAAISRHHQERIEQLRGLAAAQKEG